MLETQEIKTKHNGWKWETLGKVFKTTSGGTPTRGNKNYYTGNIPWVKSGELKHGVIFDTEEKISEEAVKNSSAKIFPKGTLLIALYGANIGKLAKLGIDAASNQAVCGILANENNNLNFLYWFLYHKRSELMDSGTGGAQPNISQTILKNLLIPAPPLPEQYRIVEKIEELFSELDYAITTLKTTQQQLQTYRQSVLKHAFEGHFTGGIEGWETNRLDQISQVGTGATPLRSNKRFWDNGHIPFITSGALNDEYVTEAFEFVTDEALNSTNIKLFPKKTLLVAMYGEGKTRGMCSELLIEATTNQAIAAIVVKKEFEQSRPYIKWFLLKNYDDVRRLSSGGVQPNLNLGLVKGILIPFPSLSIQKKIVIEIETRLSESDYLLQTINQQLIHAESLRQSILQKAFSGELL